MALKIYINAQELASTMKEHASEIEQDIADKVERLAIQTHAQGVAWAQQELKSTRDKFLDNFKLEDSVTPGVHIISVLNDALFIEEGLPNHFDMKPGLLKNAKQSKSGKYTIVPFHHEKAPSRTNPLALALINEIRAGLKQQNIPFKKIETNSAGPIHGGRDASGEPIPKLLHRVTLGEPGKTMNWLKRPGETHPLRRVSIYQTLMKSGEIRRDIVTFRTVSSGLASSDKWFHKGMEGKKYIDRLHDWAMNSWETEVLPSLLKKWELK